MVLEKYFKQNCVVESSDLEKEMVILDPKQSRILKFKSFRALNYTFIAYHPLYRISGSATGSRSSPTSIFHFDN